MGGTTSTQAGSIDTDLKVTENSNFGLLNISNESLTGGINVLERRDWLKCNNTYRGSVSSRNTLWAHQRPLLSTQSQPESQLSHCRPPSTHVTSWETLGAR